jgi:hypothetical protein
MKSFLALTAVSLLGTGSFAIAQTNLNSGSSDGATQSYSREAPIGHRQPRRADVPSEKGLSNPTDPVNKEDALLDRKIKSICRGC